MSNEVAKVSPQLAALIAANPALAKQLEAMQQSALSGISGGGPPRLGCNGTRFFIKDGGVETQVVYPNSYAVEELRGQPIATIPAIILGARDGLKKAWYATKYTPGQEVQAPDCWSNDGVKPDASSKLPQCENCASCPMNVFGTGTDMNGDPGKGKACSDSKVLAVYFSPNVYEFSIMPTALKGWKAYVKEISAYGAYLPFMITKIGFNPETSFPSYVFSAGQQLNEQQVSAIAEKMTSPEVQEILKGYSSPVAQLPAPAAAVDNSAAVKKAAEEKAAAEKKAAADKKAADKKAADEKKAAAQQAAAVADPLASLGAEIPTSTGGLMAASDDDLQALLNI